MVGEILAELRKDKNLTQDELGDILGVARGTISSYERGLSEPDDSMKIKIAKYFNVSVDYFLGLSSIPYSLTDMRTRLFIMNLPAAAEKELDSFLFYLKNKYKL